MNLKTGIIVTLGAIAGCTTATGTTEQNPGGGPTEDPAAALARVDENLARLHALDVFELGDMIVQYPQEAISCYGPCPGSEPVIEKAKGEAALRLDDFVAAAEPAAKTAVAGQCDHAVIDTHIAALRTLQIVDVTGLIVEQPKNNPNCYNTPCQEDIDAAQAITCDRAGKLASIVDATKGL